MYEQKILVMGCIRYISSYACTALHRSGYIPVTFESLFTGWRDTIDFGPFEQNDLINKAAGSSKLLKEHGLQFSVSSDN